MCPDGESQCPENQTCCLLNTGKYGCCPQPQAVCCSDGIHCCPNGYTCDLAQGSCVQSSNNQMDFFKVADAVTDIVCPDGKSKCASDTTCCKLSSGQFACCPFPNALCCSDGEHCCPKGFKCDVSAGTCTKSSMESSLFTLKEADSDSVDCGQGFICSEQTTCCKLTTGQWGCCPFPNVSRLGLLLQLKYVRQQG